MKSLLFTVFALSLIIGTLAGPLVKSTFTNSGTKFNPQANQYFNDGGNPPSGATITVNDNNRYQKMAGFGAALTESSAVLLHNLPSDVYQKTLQKVFSPTAGVGMNHIRLPISACDYSLSDWTYDDLSNGQKDPNLDHFSINHDLKHLIPVIKDIKKINPSLKIIATPWSPPAWMKNTNSLKGKVNGQDSHLLNQYKDTYASYLTKFIQAYQKQGINIDLMTIQNEPLNGATGYPGLVMDQYAQSDFINNHLSKAFLTNGIKQKSLFMITIGIAKITLLMSCKISTLKANRLFTVLLSTAMAATSLLKVPFISNSLITIFTLLSAVEVTGLPISIITWSGICKIS